MWIDFLRKEIHLILVARVLSDNDFKEKMISCPCYDYLEHIYSN